MACRGAVAATTTDERDEPAIERIAGVDVREATAEIEPATPALRTGRIGPAQPPEPGQVSAKHVLTRAGRGTMELRGLAAEPGEAIREMSV